MIRKLENCSERKLNLKKYKVLLEDPKQNTQLINNTFSQYKKASKNYDYTARKIKKIKHFNNLRKVMGNPIIALKKEILIARENYKYL